MSNVYTLDVVGRYCDPQRQVGNNTYAPYIKVQHFDHTWSMWTVINLKKTVI